MALRKFSDPDGRAWRVWDVHPDQHAGGSEMGSSYVAEGMGGGWLVFEGSPGKRRLHPIPAGWEASDDARLWSLCQQAGAVPERNAT